MGKFVDLCSGIGGFRMGMMEQGHECVGYVEIDPHARKSYQAIYDTEGEWTREDITKVQESDLDELVEGSGGVDIICAGFPCQAFSGAGNRKGFEDTRGTIFFDIARIAKYLQPKWIFMENVTGLLTHEDGETLRTILMTLNEIGYYVDVELLDSSHFGVPQARERIFIIALHKDEIHDYVPPQDRVMHPRIKKMRAKYQATLFDEGVEFFDFDFPKGEKVCSMRLKDILEEEVDESYFIPEEKVQKILADL